MAEETILEKAGKAVGFGMAMAEDLADTVKTAVGTTVTTVTGVLSKAPVEVPKKKASAKKAAEQSPAICDNVVFTSGCVDRHLCPLPSP